MTPRPLSSARLFLKILQDSRAFLPRLGFLLFLSLASIPFSLLLPLPLKIIVDYALQGKSLPSPLSGWLPATLAPSSLIAGACALEFLILLLQGTARFGIWLYQLYLADLLVADGRARLFRHAQRLSMQSLDRRTVGDVFYRLQNDVSSMHSVAVNGLIPLLSTLLTFLVMFAVALRLDAPLAFLALGVLPATWALSRLHLPKARQRWADVKSADQEALGVVQEALDATRIVRAFSQEEREVSRFRSKAERKLQRVLAAGWKEALYGILVTATVAAASATAVYLGARHVQEGRLTLGNFLIVTAYLVQLFRPLEVVSKETSTMQASLASAERYFQLMEEKPDIKDAPGARSLARAKGRIDFERVSFAYPGGAHVLRDVSFSVLPGQKVGIVGPTGAGKTSLLGLLMRFLDPAEGRILLDGTDFKDIRLADFRRQFGLVLQEPVLFAGTIAENIAYGEPAAPRAAIETAARQAEALDFIGRLPQGFETPVGQRGMTLSGGERQRLSIARALLVNTPLLVLDEPTSNLDAKHETAIRTALSQLGADKTIFTVTHRLALLDDCDLVLEVQGGGVQVSVP